MVKLMQGRMPIATSRNVPMVSIMARYILKALVDEFAAPETRHDCRRLEILAGAYFVTTFGYSLGVNEELWVDADRICQHIEVVNTSGRSPHLLVPLLRRFGGYNGDQMHVFPIANEKHSRFHIRCWLELLVNILKV